MTTPTNDTPIPAINIAAIQDTMDLLRQSGILAEGVNFTVTPQTVIDKSQDLDVLRYHVHAVIGRRKLPIATFYEDITGTFDAEQLAILLTEDLLYETYVGLDTLLNAPDVTNNAKIDASSAPPVVMDTKDVSATIVEAQAPVAADDDSNSQARRTLSLLSIMFSELEADVSGTPLEKTKAWKTFKRYLGIQQSLALVATPDFPTSPLSFDDSWLTDLNA